MITIISQINDSSNTYNLYPSRNLLMLTFRNRCDNSPAKLTFLKSIWTAKRLTWCNFCLLNFKRFSGYAVCDINYVIYCTPFPMHFLRFCFCIFVLIFVKEVQEVSVFYLPFIFWFHFDFQFIKSFTFIRNFRNMPK